MQHFESLGRDQLRRIFGITLLIILILQIVIRLKPRSRISNGWTIFAMLVSGLAQGAHWDARTAACFLDDGP